ncbi:UDP-glucose 4-epimerase GalE [Acidithiobacillus sulfurivorans]|uniref:UDP-glucose 4-epimerase n=1 Tax=Acidithiobacillus sulfurivorans TaxID=1958756 RepID=A0ABS6A291_9PROT|nr:UDP-glucose 4-epimerase GalE [Acidithiobacillus sulfurivorans]MBU2761473.1 UDP-glucose 4-epimerase GalE [Acidithiobacillus sulfurivorans]
MKILVVGGAGYIGSHMVKRLLQGGAEVVTLDNLSGGYRDAICGGAFVYGDIADTRFLNRVFSTHSFDAVMHFASYIQVGESVQEPAKYYQNNVSNTLNLLDVMIAFDVKKFIFSSTAAIFGEPQYTPIDENHPKNPINPYGRSKWMVEQALSDYDRAYGLKSACLRYFNAAGADPDGEMGERHDPETHLIPLVLQAASGRRAQIRVFGRDYETPDGTCIRDYIHVTDLAEAHWLALEHLLEGGDSCAFNLGNGNGFSVQEVIDVARQVTSKPIACEDEARRAGDPARLVADSRKIREQLGWQPRYADLANIIADAWRWETR